MNLRTQLLPAEDTLNMKRDQLVKHIMRLTCPDPDEIDAWAIGVFREDPDEECLTRHFLVFGSLANCIDAVAGCLTKLPKGTRMHILFAQGDIPTIDCRANDLCF